MNAVEKLTQFADATPEDGDVYKESVITRYDVEKMNTEEVGKFNNLIGKFRVDSDVVIGVRDGGYTFKRGATLFSGAPDGRQSTERTATDANPFRTRYYALSVRRARKKEHYDAIKAAAYELWKLIQGIPEARYEVGSPSEVNRDMALARTALEDSVMRAVRALTFAS